MYIIIFTSYIVIKYKKNMTDYNNINNTINFIKQYNLYRT